MNEKLKCWTFLATNFDIFRFSTTHSSQHRACGACPTLSHSNNNNRRRPLGSRTTATNTKRLLSLHLFLSLLQLPSFLQTNRSFYSVSLAQMIASHTHTFVSSTTWWVGPFQAIDCVKIFFLVFDSNCCRPSW